MKNYSIAVVEEALKRGNIDNMVKQALESHMRLEDAVENGLITESTLQMLDDIQYELNH